MKTIKISIHKIKVIIFISYWYRYRVMKINHHIRYYIIIIFIKDIK